MEKKYLSYIIFALIVVVIGVSYTGYTNYNKAKKYKVLSDSITNMYNREREISETYRKVDSLIWIDHRNYIDKIPPSRLDSAVNYYEKLSRLYR